MKIVKCFSVLFVSLLFTACASVAPNYQPNFETINILKDQDIKNVEVGGFTEENPSVNKVVVRGATLVSPYEKSYAKYLENALEEDLKQAALWNSDSRILISGVLLENNLDAAGIKTATSDLSAQFVVTQDGEQIYNKTHSTQHEWSSSFLGAVAFSNAQENLAVSFQKLVRAFLLDPEFLEKLKN